MKERPIIFSAESVRAILAGRKTQTRRIYKPKRPPPWEILDEDDGGELWPFWQDGNGEYHAVRCPFGVVGSKLWVRETWQHSGDPGEYHDDSIVFYRADYFDDPHGYDGEKSPEGTYRKWRPSIHMPRAASRITLEITDIRVERLQDISEEDAKAEGVYWSNGNPVNGLATELIVDARESYRELWDSIHSTGSWAANPWVWVLSFKRIEP